MVSAPDGEVLLVVIGALLWALLLSHSLTAIWVIGIIWLRGLPELVHPPPRQALSRVVRVWSVATIAALLTLVWPYFDITQSPALRLLREGSEFGDHPLRDMARMYVLASAAALWFLWHRKHHLLVGGFLATFVTLEVWRALDYSYGNRFFQAFFAQVMVAEGVGVGVLLGLRQEQRLSIAVEDRHVNRLAPPLFAAVAVVLSLTAPIIRSEAQAGRPLLGLRTLLARYSAHDAYYRSLDPLPALLTRDDVVLMPVERLAFDVASITGARVVVSPFAYRVPDYVQRVEDVKRFLSPGVPSVARRTMIEQYSVSKILLTAPYVGLAEELAPHGTLILSSGALALIDVARVPGRSAMSDQR